MRVFRGAIFVTSLLIASTSWTQDFSTVTIRPSASTGTRESRLQILPRGDLVAKAVPFIELFSLAYGVPDNPSPRVSPMPEWTVSKLFDIEAKVPVSLKVDAAEPAVRERTVQHLLRSLLITRFGLQLTVRTERVPVYGVAAAQGGPKLKEAVMSHCVLDTGPEGCHSFAPGFGHPLNASAVDMTDLAQYLGNWTDLPVVDRTGLSGLYTMQSQGWRPTKLPPPPPGGTGLGGEFESLPPLSAVLRQSGLMLRKQEEAMPFYTVKRVHLPAEK